jgi:hypothetical protein
MILHEQIELNDGMINWILQVRLVDGFTVTLVRYAFNGIYTVPYDNSFQNAR